jgi:hypothetical protein
MEVAASTATCAREERHGPARGESNGDVWVRVDRPDRDGSMAMI